MKNKRRIAAAIVAAICLLIGGTLGVRAEGAHAVGESLLDGIVSYKLSQSGASSVQGWIDGELTRTAGVSAEWYVFGLRQYGSYDFSGYASALETYDADHHVSSATTRQKHALALLAAGGDETTMLDMAADTVGSQGVMSYVFGLHLLRCGVPCGASLSQARSSLLSLQLSDGGWAVMGKTGDVDVTAMTLQALAPDYRADTAVTSAVDKAVSFLSEQQQPAGDFRTYGVNNAESTAQVLLALSALGIDPADARFTKDGHSVLDGLATYRLSSGAFCHTVGGGYNELATAQTFDALVAYRRMTASGFDFYRFPYTPSTPATTRTAGTTARTTAKPALGTTATTATTAANVDQPTNSEFSDDSAVSEEPDSSEPSQETWQTQTTRTTAPTTASASADTTGRGGYKEIVTLVIAGLGLLTCGLLWGLKKRHFKNFLAVALAAAVLIAGVWLTDIQTPDDYYSGAAPASDAVGTVTMSIRCDVLKDQLAEREDLSYLPADGVILGETEFSITEGESVFDLLDAAARTHHIQVDSRGVQVGTRGSVYVSGIAYLYEFDFGELSGWMYRVNGDTPSVGCGEYELHPGDRVEWLYTLNMGHDLPA